MLRAVLALGFWLLLAWSSRAALADCSDSGTKCSAADKIRDQTVREGKEQRANWYGRRGASSGSGAGPYEQAMCISLATIDRHCRALRAVAAERWSWSDKGTEKVAELLQGGPEPRCFTSEVPYDQRVRIWARQCGLSLSEQGSLLGIDPNARPKKAVTKGEESKKPALTGSTYVSPEDRKKAELRDRYWARYYRVIHEGPKRVETARSLGQDPQAERIRCAWGSEQACAALIELSLEKDESSFVAAVQRSCEAGKWSHCPAPSEFFYGDEATRFVHPSFVLEGDCALGSNHACSVLIGWHLGDDVKPSLPEEGRDPVFGRWLAHESCRGRNAAACLRLDRAIREGAGGAATAGARERRVLHAACENSRKGIDGFADAGALCSAYGREEP